MTFTSWILKFEQVNLAIGDLSRDIKSDSDFPVSSDYDTLRNYLEKCGASDPCMTTFENAFKYFLLEYPQ